MKVAIARHEKAPSPVGCRHAAGLNTTQNAALMANAEPRNDDADNSAATGNPDPAIGVYLRCSRLPVQDRCLYVAVLFAGLEVQQPRTLPRGRR